jgi:hypothetical protein
MQRPNLFRRIGLVVLLLPLAACSVPMTSSNTYLVPIANGETMEISIKNGGLVLAEQDGIHILQVALNPSSNKKDVVYTFEFSAKNGLVPTHVLIEDLTETPIKVVADDPAPKLKDGHWKLDTPVLDPKDPTFEWLVQLDDTIRVYRFTITLADGRQVVLRQPQMFPVFMKQLIRVMTGIDKPAGK